MSATTPNAPPRGIDDAGSPVAGARGRQLTAGQKIAVASLVLVVFLGFIWIGQLNKATREVHQPDVPLSAGGAFHAPPSQPTLLAVTPAALPMPAAAPTAPLLGLGRREMTAAESPIFAFSGGGGIPEAAAGAFRKPRRRWRRPPSSTEPRRIRPPGRHPRSEICSGQQFSRDPRPGCCRIPT